MYSTLKISAILPLYNPNHEHLIVMINSLLNQSHNNFELIVVDDSLEFDKNYDIFTSFNNLSFKYFHNKERLGIQSSLNKCIKNISGDFIARVDADDFYHPSRFNSQIDFLVKNTDYDICGTFCIKVNDEGKNVGKISYPQSHKEISNVLHYKNTLAHPSVMVRKNFFSTFGFYSNEYINEDYELWMRAKEQGCKFYNLSSYLTFYRLSGPDENFKIRNWKDNFNIKVRYFSFKNILYSILGIISVSVMMTLPKFLSQRIHQIINLNRS